MVAEGLAVAAVAVPARKSENELHAGENAASNTNPANESETKNFPEENRLNGEEKEQADVCDPSCLPDFAGDDVRNLSELVLEAEKALRNIEEAVEEQDERASIMEEHMKRVEQEIVNTQFRADAKRREIATEEHLKKLSEMEVSRLQRDLRRIEKETEDTKSRMRALSSSMYKANEKMDRFRQLMQWNQEELEQWAKAAKQKDEDNFALQTYTKSDNAKLKELYLESEKVSSDLCMLEQALDTEATATQSAQIELNKTAEVFRDMHRERKHLIQLWEDAVETIHKRDESIHKAAEEFAENKSQLRGNKHHLDDVAEKLEREIQMNKELERRVVAKEEEAAKAYESHKEELSRTKEAEEELILLKGNLQHATVQLAALISQKFQAEEDLKMKKKKLQVAVTKLQEVKSKVENEFILLDTLDKKRQELERILSAEETNLNAAKREVANIREKHYEASEKLKLFCDKEKDTTFEIKGANSQSKALTKQIHQMEASMLKQEEVLYSAEFQIQCLERKVARASGDRSDLESKELKVKISELEKELEEKKAEECMVNDQIKRSEEDHRAARRKREELQKKLARFEEKNSELMLASETGLNTVKVLVKEKEEKMLARDLLQMEVNRLQEILNLKSDAVYGMENTRQRLKMGMDERKNEIESRFEKKRMELKLVQEELHNLTLKKKKLYMHCEKLQAKYEVLLQRVKVEEGHERSPAYYLIKADQERESIQMEENQLENQVHQVQHDVKTLEVAVQDIKEANDLLRHSHRSAKSIEMAQEQGELKDDLDKALAKLHDQQKLEQSLLDEVAMERDQLENIEKESMGVSEALKNLEEKVEAANKGLNEQMHKLKRAETQVNKIRKELKDTLGDEAERISREIQLVELRETAKEVLYKFKSLIDEIPEYSKIIEDRVSEVGMKMPSSASSLRSSRSSKSSMSSRGSTSTTKSSLGGIISSPRSMESSRTASIISHRSGSVVNLEFQGGS